MFPDSSEPPKHGSSSHSGQRAYQEPFREQRYHVGSHYSYPDRQYAHGDRSGPPNESRAGHDYTRTPQDLRARPSTFDSGEGIVDQPKSTSDFPFAKPAQDYSRAHFHRMQPSDMSIAQHRMGTDRSWDVPNHHSDSASTAATTSLSHSPVANFRSPAFRDMMSLQEQHNGPVTSNSVADRMQDSSLRGGSLPRVGSWRSLSNMHRIGSTGSLSNMHRIGSNNSLDRMSEFGESSLQDPEGVYDHNRMVRTGSNASLSRMFLDDTNMTRRCAPCTPHDHQSACMHTRHARHSCGHVRARAVPRRAA